MPRRLWRPFVQDDFSDFACRESAGTVRLLPRRGFADGLLFASHQQETLRGKPAPPRELDDYGDRRNVVFRQGE
jgi:hypothetical protein